MISRRPEVPPGTYPAFVERVVSEPDCVRLVFEIESGSHAGERVSCAFPLQGKRLFILGRYLKALGAAKRGKDLRVTPALIGRRCLLTVGKYHGGPSVSGVDPVR